MRGELVEPSSIDKIKTESDDYIADPEAAWSRALGRPLRIDDVARAYFRDNERSSLFAPDDVTKKVRFSPDHFVMTIADF